MKQEQKAQKPEEQSGGGRKFILLKVIHTLIWVFFNVVIFYLLYAVLTNRIDNLVWICLGLIALEGLTLLVFRNMCPLTVVARKYSASTRDNFDIYLPNWLARYNKQIYTTIVIISILILLYRLFENSCRRSSICQYVQILLVCQGRSRVRKSRRAAGKEENISVRRRCNVI